jgi:hypothetical protein
MIVITPPTVDAETLLLSAADPFIAEAILAATEAALSPATTE